mmetsp:Transcript_27398/g.50372  ORF Transcript_27398/g.50372 Transcript_27398/m.50372 type:complete len:122 (-) Transcript_27398:589-954(-)
MTHPPITAAYCHCADCRRWTGAPVTAFAAFDSSAVQGLGEPVRFGAGVSRWACAACSSPLAATFDYLPGQTYVPVGILDQVDLIRPELHSHADSRVAWLHIADDLPRYAASARTQLADEAS